MTESRSPLPHKRIGVAVITDDQGHILIDRRKQEGLLGGLWEFPGGKIEPDETVEDCVKREIKEELDIEIEVGSRLVTIEHAYTHFKVTLNVFNCKHLSGDPKPLESDEVKWVTLDEIDQYPFPKANSQIIDAIKAQARKLQQRSPTPISLSFQTAHCFEHSPGLIQGFLVFQFWHRVGH